MKLRITRTDDDLIKVDDVFSALNRLMNAQVLCSMASVNEDASPHINNAYYAFTKLNQLFFASEPESRHTTNFLSRPEVAISIAASTQPWGSELCGAQLFGECHQVTGATMVPAYGAYGSRFLKFKDWISNPSELISGACETRMFEVIVKSGKLFDETSFGKDVYVEFELVE